MTISSFNGCERRWLRRRRQCKYNRSHGRTNPRPEVATWKGCLAGARPSARHLLGEIAFCAPGALGAPAKWAPQDAQRVCLRLTPPAALAKRRPARVGALERSAVGRTARDSNDNIPHSRGFRYCTRHIALCWRTTAARSPPATPGADRLAAGATTATDMSAAFVGDRRTEAGATQSGKNHWLAAS